jgi:nicotinamide phosphoribosyltransferase
MEKVFGVDMNEKCYKVIRGAGVIQGDGIDHAVIGTILDTAMAAGYSAQNIAFGMGSALVQKVNRDTTGFVIKLSQVTLADGTVQ